MFENIDAYSKLLKIAQRNPNNLKRLIAVAPIKPLSLDNVDDIIDGLANIKHYHVKDDTSVWVNYFLDPATKTVDDIIDAEIISLDFCKCKGSTPAKRAFLLNLLGKIKDGTTVLVWNYALQTLPKNLVDVFNKVIEPTSYTYKESNTLSVNEATLPVLINKMEAFETVHETFDMVLRDDFLKKKSIIHLDCNVYYEMLCEDLDNKGEIRNIGTMRGLDIWRVLNTEFDTYMLKIKDGTVAHASKILEICAELSKTSFSTFRIIIVSNNNSLIKPLETNISRVAVSFQLFRSKLFSKRLKANESEIVKNRFLKKPDGQFNEPMEIIDLNRCIEFISINKTLEWFKHNGGINVKVICLTYDTFNKVTNYLKRDEVDVKECSGYAFQNTDSLDFVEDFKQSLQGFIESRVWKNNRTGFNFFFFCKLNRYKDNEKIIDHLNSLEYLIKSFEVVNAIDPEETQNDFTKVEPVVDKPDALNVDDLFSTGWLDNQCEEPQPSDDGLNKAYADLIGLSQPQPDFFKYNPSLTSADVGNGIPTDISAKEWITRMVNGGLFDQVDGYYKLTPVIGALSDYKSNDTFALKVSYLVTMVKESIINSHLSVAREEKTKTDKVLEINFATTVKLIGRLSKEVLAINDAVIIPAPNNSIDKCWALFPSTMVGVDTLIVEIDKMVFGMPDFSLSKVFFKRQK